MNNNLTSQVNKLKEIKPDYEWKKNNREVLFSQISSTQTDKLSRIELFRKRVSIPTIAMITQPVMMAVLVIVVLFNVSVELYNVTSTFIVEILK